jgi:hypothetical protein
MKKNVHITATFVWSFDDFVARRKALVTNPVASSGKKTSIFPRLVYGLLILAIAWVIVKLLNNQITLLFPTIQNYLPLIGIYLLLSIALWAIFTFIQRRNLKQSFLKSPDSNKSVLVTITRDEIVMKADGSSENRWNWKALNEVRKTPKGFVFFQAPRTVFWIPNRAFQSVDDIETVSELAKRLTPKFSITASKPFGLS